MKKKGIAYRVSAIFVASIMTASGVLAISHAPTYMKAHAHLGYPPYFSNTRAITARARKQKFLTEGPAGKVTMPQPVIAPVRS